MAAQIGEAVIKLTFDGNNVKASLQKVNKDVKTSGEDGGKNYGDAWVVAAGNLMADGLKKIARKLTNIGKQVFTTGMGFEDQMTRVRAIAGLTDQEFTAVQDKALSLASTSIFTSEETGKALEYMGMAGWKAEQMMEGLPGILQLGAINGRDLASTSDIVTDALTAFGYEASEATHFADVLAKTIVSSNTDVNMMGEAFKYVGAIAGSLKFNVEDVSIALGLMANRGVKASQAGTSLRQAFSRLISPTKSGMEAMEMYGVSIFDAEGKSKDLMTVMKELRKAFGGVEVDVAKAAQAVEEGDEAWEAYQKSLPITAQEKMQALTDIFTVRSMPAMLAVIDASDEEFATLTDTIYGAEGAAEDISKTMESSTAGAWRRFLSTVDVLFVKLSENLLPSLEGIFKFMTDNVWVIEMIFNTISGFINFLVSNWWILGGILTFVSSLLAMNFGKKVLSFLSATKAAIIAHPILATITAVAMGAAFIVQHWEGIANFFKTIWEGICVGAQGVWDFITWLFGQMAAYFGGVFSTAWEAVKAVFSTGGQIFMGIVDGITNAFRAIVNTIIKGINAVVAIPFNAINGFLSFLKGIDILGLKPFDWVATISVPQIPLLAEGGYASGASHAVIGEAGKEVVLPLENNTDNWSGLLAEALVDKMEEQDNAKTINVYMENQINNKLDADEIGRLMIQSIRRAA